MTGNALTVRRPNCMEEGIPLINGSEGKPGRRRLFDDWPRMQNAAHSTEVCGVAAGVFDQEGKCERLGADSGKAQAQLHGTVLFSPLTWRFTVLVVGQFFADWQACRHRPRGR